MMKNLKAKSGSVGRLLVTHIGMAVFGTVLFLWTNQMGQGLTLAVGIFSALFYAMMVYVPMWELGAKDKAAIDAGRLDGYKSIGFSVGAAAQLPFILLTLIYFVCSFFPESAAAASVFAVCYAILILIDGCFTGIMITLAPRGENFYVVAAVFLLGSLFIVAVSGIAYLLGTKEWQLFPKKANK